MQVGGAELAPSLEVWTDLDRLPCIGRLGGGTFGRVSLHRTAEGEPRAVKTFRTTCSDAMRQNEFSVYTTMLESPHHNVLQAIAVVFIPPGPMLSAFVRPHLDSSLRDWMQRRIFMFTPEEACDLATQIFAAAGHLHSVGFMHRDIKPDNFLVNISTRDAPVLKLCDFGWAKRVGKDAHVLSAEEAHTPGCTTWPYRAPEVYMKLPYGIAADTWSCGVIVRELVVGQSVHQIGQYEGLEVCIALGGAITEETWPGCSRTAAWQSCTRKEHKPWPKGHLSEWPGLLWYVQVALSVPPEKRLWATQIRDGLDSCRGSRLLAQAPVFSDSVVAEALEEIARDGDLATASDGVLVAAAGGGQASDGVVAEVTGGGGGGEAQVVGQCACNGDGNYCTASGHRSRGKNKCLSQCLSRATRGPYCDECVCAADGCEQRRQRIAYCRKHWHLCSALSIEIRTVRLFRASLPKMLPADIQAWTKISPKLPISVLWIAAQLWEPLAVEHFVSKCTGLGMRPPRDAALGNAFASTALHMHERGQKDDGVAMAHLSLLGEQGMCRFFWCGGPWATSRVAHACSKPQTGPR